jgi:hypothetical protein
MSRGVSITVLFPSLPGVKGCHVLFESFKPLFVVMEVQGDKDIRVLGFLQVADDPTDC